MSARLAAPLVAVLLLGVTLPSPVAAVYTALHYAGSPSEGGGWPAVVLA
jgi:hypothetical protein